MRIDEIELKGVKSFDDTTKLTLDPDTSLFALSGMNGAGKSTILKMPWLVQKAHFVSKISDSGLAVKQFAPEVGRYLNHPHSHIKIHFSEGDDRASIKIFPAVDHGYGITYENRELVDKSWSLKNPSNLILYVDASKGFSEETSRFDELSIGNNERDNLALQAVLNPEELFTRIYHQLVKDWVHGRLIPSKPDRLLYYRIASKMFTGLIPTVELSNFSGKHKSGEFVLLGKANREKHKPLYDVREFSSGEKSLLSTLTFLCISKSVSTLIIDEPENHFHENLLLEFMTLLHKLCQKGGIQGWAEADKNSALKLDWVASEYKNHNLNQVLVSTHSKSLIYRFFLLGRNYVISKGLQPISVDEAESKLREIGLSTLQSRVLLVEGKGDQEALESATSDKNVAIRPLDGSRAVIETFIRLASVRNDFKDSRFVFLVDEDNKPESYFDDLRSKNAEFYEESFVRMDRHEFENYFLDSDLFVAALKKYAIVSGTDSNVPTSAEVHKKLVELAKGSLPLVYKKELSLAFQQAISTHFSSLIWGNKLFDWSSSAAIQAQLTSNVLTSSELENLKDELAKNVASSFSGYATADDEMLLRRCDGKSVLNQACAHFAKAVGVQGGTFKKAMYHLAFTEETSEVSKLRSRILSKLG